MKSDEDIQQDRIRARKELARFAWSAFNIGIARDIWVDSAPQWAIDITPQNEIDHLTAFVWGSPEMTKPKPKAGRMTEERMKQLLEEGRKVRKEVEKDIAEMRKVPR